MSEITHWLDGLGLAEYAPRFVENDIELSLLPELSDQDLKELGVGSLGHRRKILRAIADLANAAGPAPPPARAATPRAETAPIAAPAAVPRTSAAAGTAALGERRYLTVMFCDLVGSTRISSQLDAEEWRDLVGAYLDAASAAVTEMGGHVAKKLGDGLMALFGYPLAQENDAERAARAALAILRALADLNRANAGSGKPELAARIGLEAGPVVVDAAGEIFGDAPNIAARVQALAEPGAVLVTARVQRQIAGLFVAEERGSHALKGVPDPTVLFRLTRGSGGGRRSGARQLTPLVGRDDEMAMLMRRWERARQGDGQLVLIVGEPGLGKSRLIEEFHGRLRDTPHTWVEWSSSQLLQNTPLHPIAEWGRQRFGGADVPAERRLADLENTLALLKLDPAEHVPLIAPLIDIPLPKERMPTLAPEELRTRQLAALTNWVIVGAKMQPVVLAIEDLHWADPTTIDVLRGIAERGALAPLFILATTRPEFRPPWSMRSHHGTISLAPLDRAQVRDMVAELAARNALPRDVVDDVAARTGGVPLFVEEVTRLLLERGGGQDGIHAIPPTLQQSLMARLDRLGAAREVAQIGSVIGRGFSYGLLRDVAGMEDASLQAALEKLAEADIVLVQGAPPESDYRFKHALIQDAAYENLLKSRRQILHRRVAEILRDRFADTAAAEPEALAHHFTQAGMTDAAIEWWGKAGDQALRRSAFQEAIAHLGKAIEMADKEGKGAPRPAAAAGSAGQRAKLQTSYGQAMMWSKGFGAEETKAAFTRAQELATGIDNAAERFTTNYGLWIGRIMRGELGLARETAETFRSETAGGARTTEAAAACRNLGVTRLFQGDYPDAQALLEEALRIYDPGWDRDAKFRFGMESGVIATAYLAHTIWLLGNVGRARELIEEAVVRAVESDHVPTKTQTYFYKALFEIFRGDAAATRRATETVLELSREHGITLHLTLGGLSSIWARVRLGDRETGMTELRRALAAYTDQGNKLYVPLYQGLLAEIQAEEQQTEEASTLIDEALALSGETGEHWADALLHRIRGEILLKRDPTNPGPAEEAFLTAIAIAQQQKARSFELRAALSLAKLYKSINRGADAHAVLSPALEGFAPTPEFPEIAEAQSLLAGLAETDDLKNAAAARQRRLQLQTGLANALLQARGQHSPETQEAFSRARELAGGIEDPLQRFSSYYGLWVGGYVRSEKATMVEAAEALLKESASRPESAEACIAHRIYGTTCWVTGGDVTTAREHVEKAVTLYRPERDRDLAFRFAQDIGVAARVYLSLVQWVLGEPDRARDLMNEALSLASETGHAPSLVYAQMHASILEMVRADPRAAKRHAEAGLALAREHGLKLWTMILPVTLAWEKARGALSQFAWEEMRKALADCHEQGIVVFTDVMFGVLLAEGSADAGRIEDGLALVDQGITQSERSGIRWFDAEAHRIRGEILLKRDPANTAPAEEAFLTAIAVAQQQKARSFELHAALALAKLYQRTNRLADAHAVLAPALEGFSPTPEFPEIAEAQSLLAGLAETDDLKNAAAARQRRVQLQTKYGQAMMWSRGFGAEEAKSAFSRAKDLARAIDDPSERLATHYGLWIGSLMRGEFEAARETAETFFREAQSGGFATETGVARRSLGTTYLFLGHLTRAREELAAALAAYDPQRDREAVFRFGLDSGTAAAAYLALATWLLGEVDGAPKLMDEALTRATDCAHVPTLATTHNYKTVFELLRGDAKLAKRHAEESLKLSREHGLAFLEQGAAQGVSAANGRIRAPAAGTGEDHHLLVAHAESSRLSAAYAKVGNKFLAPFYGGLLAEVEAEASNGDAALARLDRALALAGETGEHWSDPLLHRIRGEILLKRDPANTAPAEEAFLAAIAVAQQQKAKSFELRAALSLAKLYQSTGRAADAHDVLASALEGFSPTPEFPEIEEAQKLLATLSETDEVKNAATSRQRRLKLQTSYGQAMLWSKGFGAEETKAAYTRAKELVAGIGDAAERFPTYYGLWVGSFSRGELAVARDMAETFLHEAKADGRPTEAGVAGRNLGLTCLFQGDVTKARGYLEEALRNYDPERDREAKFRFGMDSGPAATANLAHITWVLGDVGRARELIEEAVMRAVESAHAPTMANIYHFKAVFEVLRGDAAGARRAAETLVELARKHELTLYLAVGSLSLALARARLGERETGAMELRALIAAYTEQGSRAYLPLYQGLLAELEAEAQGAEDASARIDEALALATETGEHWTDAFLHRIRGEVLLRRDPANTAPAQEAFLTAIAIAQQQKARSFELRAALSLAKLYQSTGRPADAHAVLAPALEGFSPTPEFPEIEQAQTLLAALATSDEVKNAAAARARRLKLQTSYGQAVMWSKGFGAEETKAALARTLELAEGIANPAERYVAYYGQWANAFMRCEFGLADEAAEKLLREANNDARMPEAATANRILGYTRLVQGALTDARAHLEQALRIYDPRWVRDDKLLLSLEPGPAAMAYLALASWLLGEVGRARELIEQSVAGAAEAAHVPTLGNCLAVKALLEMLRGDAEAALSVGKTTVEFTRERGLGNFLPMARVFFGWARAHLGERDAGMDELRQGLAAHIQAGNKIFSGWFQGVLAELEAEGQDPEGALARLDEALASANKIGEHWTDALLHRIRGEILLKRDPASTAPAEEAFLTAIAIAQQQKAKSFELRAALSLAKLYQSTNRAADAHAVLAPALEGFAPTPEFPEIAEALTLFAELARARS